ncbi:MAG: hypothetical protein HY653_00845 [Acidobacteria bacterium]|nr:hypothetical protein [Acidobacteriota bacterium]
MAGLSPPWPEFLQELDKLLPRPAELHCLGGFVLAALYQRPIPTEDLDYLDTLPGDDVQAIESIAGRDSELAKRYKVHLQVVTIADVPENYETRLEPILPGSFLRLRLLALEVHDIVLSKLVRNSPVDDADVRFLIQKGVLDAATLCERYERELRPLLLAHQERHDTTLRLWLEYFKQ